MKDTAREKIGKKKKKKESHIFIEFSGTFMLNVLRLFSKNLKIFGLNMEVITLHKCLIKLMYVDPQMKQALVTIVNEPFCAILLFIPQLISRESSKHSSFINKEVDTRHLGRRHVLFHEHEFSKKQSHRTVLQKIT